MVHDLALAAAIIKNVKLPNPQHTDQYLWPSPTPAIRIDQIMPTMTKEPRRYSAEWGIAQEEERAAARNQERAEQKRREDADAAAHPNLICWWEGQKFPPGKAI